MEFGSASEKAIFAEKIACKSFSASALEQGLETAILDYAISTFPFYEAFESVPGYREEELSD